MRKDKNMKDIVSTLLEEKNDDLEYADVKKHDIPKEQAIDPIFYIKNDFQLINQFYFLLNDTL